MEEEEEQTLYMSLEYIDSPDCKPAENKCDIIISKSGSHNNLIPIFIFVFPKKRTSERQNLH